MLFRLDRISWILGEKTFDLWEGILQTLEGRDSILLVYATDAGEKVVCQMYDGNLSELPEGGSRREKEGKELRVYQSRGYTLAFWQEGSLVCVMTSALQPEEVVQLAFDKALRS